MNEELQELATGPLDTNGLVDSISGIVAFFEERRGTRVRIMLGIGCHLPIDDLFRWEEIALDEVKGFIDQKRERGFFELGSCDLFIEDIEGTAAFRLCHESDVHFATLDRALADRVLREWKGRGLIVLSSTARRAGSGLTTENKPRRWEKAV
jgi:hypothetical protein